MDEVAIARCQVEIINAYGLQLRAAAKFEKLASSFRAEIWVDYRGSQGQRQEHPGSGGPHRRVRRNTRPGSSWPGRRGGPLRPGRPRGSQVPHARRGCSQVAGRRNPDVYRTSIEELQRVAAEVRVVPLLTLERRPLPAHRTVDELLG